MAARTDLATSAGGQGARNPTIESPRSPHGGRAAAPVSSTVLPTPPNYSSQRRSASHRSLQSSPSPSPSVTFSTLLPAASRNRSIPHRLLAPVLQSVSSSSSSSSSRPLTFPPSSLSSTSYSVPMAERPSSPPGGEGGEYAATSSSSSSSSVAGAVAAVRRSRSRSGGDGRDHSALSLQRSPPASPRPVASASAYSSSSSSSSLYATSSSPRTPRDGSRRFLSTHFSCAGKKSTAAAAASAAPASPFSSSSTSADDAALRARAKSARLANDAMVYLDGPCVYTCAQCRTHLTSHDDIISKSFHGRHGRAYLFDQCVNVTVGPAEDRLLITGMHSVCDIRCRRCDTMVGWTYKRAYEASQKYKEGKFIVEKINLHLEETDAYDVGPPAGERGDRWRKRSMSWGDGRGVGGAVGVGSTVGGGFSSPHLPRQRIGSEHIVYEYRPDYHVASLGVSPYRRSLSLITDPLPSAASASASAGRLGGEGRTLPPSPPNL